MTPPKTIAVLYHPDGGSWRFDGPTGLAEARRMAATERRGAEQTIAVYELKGIEKVMGTERVGWL